MGSSGGTDLVGERTKSCTLKPHETITGRTRKFQLELIVSCMKEANYSSLARMIDELSRFEKVLFLTCSNRYGQILRTQDPKSTILAKVMASKLDNVTIINVPDLNIYPCEGNVSREDGNRCGVREATLKDDEKNPTGYHRCWASIHNPDDELWKISKELFESDCVMFFASVRWGQANMYYQKLIERLNWINNRFVPLGEDSVIKNIESGFMIVGQHYGGEPIAENQMAMHDYFGFKVNPSLYSYWQAEDIYFDDETLRGYLESYPRFYSEFRIKKRHGGID
jgi:multimeric flavodoxin WrbA